MEFPFSRGIGIMRTFVIVVKWSRITHSYTHCGVYCSLCIIRDCCKVIRQVDGQGADLGQLSLDNLSSCRRGGRPVFRGQDPLQLHPCGVPCVRRSSDGCLCTPHVTSTHFLTPMHTEFFGPAVWNMCGMEWKHTLYRWPSQYFTIIGQNALEMSVVHETLKEQIYYYFFDSKLSHIIKGHIFKFYSKW